SRVRVRVRLVEAEVEDIHEDDFTGDGEIVFSVQVFSPFVQSHYNYEDPISEFGHWGGEMDYVEFEEGEHRDLDITLFDDFIIESETQLYLDFETVEVDNSVLYSISELSDD